MVRENHTQHLWELGFRTVQELETDTGILASGKGEMYACIFGRDSLITCLKLLSAYETTQNEYFIDLSKKILENLARLQGSEVNCESGEEPGKMIHEYRPTDHERLTKREKGAWYVYPDNEMRNYDSVDSTPLFLIACARYIEVTGDLSFEKSLEKNIRAALLWIIQYGDKNDDGFIDYQFPEERTYGGLKVQSWMDSKESLFHEDGVAVTFPIAPVEVQAYAYAALSVWAIRFQKNDHQFAQALEVRAKKLKADFNRTFVLGVGHDFVLASAVDGSGKRLRSVRSSMGHVLWASWKEEDALVPSSILNQEYISLLAVRLMQSDLFEPKAGIRTLSTASRNYNPLGYHNGSIWPHDSGIIAEGLARFGFIEPANKIRDAIAHAINVFGSAVELVTVVDNELVTGGSEGGQKACNSQAWTAATLVAEM